MQIQRESQILHCLVTLMLWVGVASLAYSAIDVHEFSSDKNRVRYEKFIDELRCPKCQNENLAGSSSEIAKDLRRELHRLIETGETDQFIVDFMVNRYGDYVLYRPRLKTNTLALWFGPLLLLALAMLMAVRFAMQRRLVTETSDDMSSEEQLALEKMLAVNTESGASTNRASDNNDKGS